jgi:hypothetical protein
MMPVRGLCILTYQSQVIGQYRRQASPSTLVPMWETLAAKRSKSKVVASPETTPSTSHVDAREPRRQPGNPRQTLKTIFLA